MANRPKPKGKQQLDVESEMSDYMKKDDEVRAPLLDNMPSPRQPARHTAATTAAASSAFEEKKGTEPSTHLGSQSRAQDSQGKKKKRYLCGLSVKKDTTYWNLLAMPMLPFISCTINFYAMAFIPLLLGSPDYFNVDSSNLGKATAMTLIWAQLLPLVLTPFMTFVYEGIGRRIPLTYAMLSTNLLIWLMPRVAPSMTLLCGLRAVIGLNNTLSMAAPLISDYVKQESRGRAVTVNTLAIALSQIYATQCLVPLTQNMNFDESFTISSLMMLILTIPTLFMIREPKPKKLASSVENPNGENLPINDTEAAAADSFQTDSQEEDQTCCGLIKTISKTLVSHVCTDIKWIFLFLAASQAHLLSYLYSSYLVLWLNSFAGSTEDITTSDDVQMVYSRMTLVSIPAVMFTLLVMGLFSDNINPVFQIAPAFIVRSLICFAFKLVDNPTSPVAYACSSLLLMSSTVLVISLESLFMKNLPREARGAMTILLTFFISIAALLFHGVGGPVFDLMGPASPFVLVSGLDFALAIFATILGGLGYLSYQSNPAASGQPELATSEAALPRSQNQNESVEEGTMENEQRKSLGYLQPSPGTTTN